MEIRTKKLRGKTTVKMLTGGRVDQVRIHSDMYDADSDKVSICFRGRISSGIIQMTKEEASDLYRTLGKTGFLKAKKD
ncbi:hypothetical protein HOE04_03310 [archaeon]|jgi:hypothetical protein|nr:hypothetical protein [archaeon]